jgi:hypothetical protein
MIDALMKPTDGRNDQHKDYPAEVRSASAAMHKEGEIEHRADGEEDFIHHCDHLRRLENVE